MTAIERTAYPRLRQDHYRKNDLAIYVPTEDEMQWMQTQQIRLPNMQLNLMVQLKTFQRLGHFTPVENVPGIIIRKVRQTLGSSHGLKVGYPHKDALYHHRKLIREYLQISNNDKAREKLISITAQEIAQSMNDPADIINAVVEELIHHRCELPAFSSLERSVNHIRETINSAIFKTLTTRLEKANKLELLDKTLIRQTAVSKTAFNDFKQLPAKPTIKNFKALTEHNNGLTSFGDFNLYVKHISKIKVAQFADENR